MLLLTAAETGRVYDKKDLLILWGLGIKARVHTDDAPHFKYQDHVVELHARMGQLDDKCVYFFIGGDGIGVPVEPKYLTRVPDDTPLTIQYSDKTLAEIAAFRSKGIARAKWLIAYQAYVYETTAAVNRGEKFVWNPPEEPK